MAGAGILSVSATFRELLLECARAEGFPLASALDIDLAAPELQKHIERYDEWLAGRREGAMEYLRRGRDRRADPRLVMPSAQSMLCVAIPYPAAPAGAADSASGPRYARYLRRNDYHDDIAERLERVMQSVRARWSGPLEWKICVDTSAVLERSWAALAGLGWIGKNTLLIHPQLGSYLFLGEVLISEKTGAGPSPIANYCGNCTRCLDACPTKAFRGAGELDSNRCISYWTLEKRGELSISDDDRRAMGTWIAGCDLCQEVCPFNTKAAKSAPPEESTAGATSLQDWGALLDEDQERYKARIHESALSRVKPAQFSRNLAIALANAIRTNPELLPTLQQKIRKRAAAETDPVAAAEWQRLL